MRGWRLLKISTLTRAVELTDCDGVQAAGTIDNGWLKILAREYLSPCTCSRLNLRATLTLCPEGWQALEHAVCLLLNRAIGGYKGRAGGVSLLVSEEKNMNMN
jgi:hypothetical protein